VFHEPSNRWICFESLDYTPEDGYNVILELTYDIVKGFEGGLGYDFDEDTRFAIFDLVTSANAGIDVALSEGQEIVLTANPPTSVTSTVDFPDTNTTNVLALTVPSPSLTITSVSINETDLTWNAAEYGSTYKEIRTVTVTKTIDGIAQLGVIATITSLPTWLTVAHTLGYSLSVGSTLTDGQQIEFYPTASNTTGYVLSGTFTIEDEEGNEYDVLVTQNAGIVLPVVHLTLDDEEVLLVLDAVTCTATVASTTVHLVFTPDYPGKSASEEYEMHYYIFKNGISVSADLTFNVNEDVSNSRYVTMSSTATYGDIIYVYLYVDTGVGSDITVDSMDVDVDDMIIDIDNL